ncbi:MAG TPA: hypothetical protein VKT82_31575 [Ktedonobacterales bacterium]|nr:hypothetical protein [Ktedonobacterales bacterium]
MKNQPETEGVHELLQAHLRDVLVANARLRREHAQMYELLRLFLNEAWPMDVSTAKERARTFLAQYQEEGDGDRTAAARHAWLP